jgi:hypothetical protein
MRTMMPLAATHIEMEIKGKEVASFIHFRYETHQNADGTSRTERIPEKKKSHRKIIEYKAPVFLFQGGNLVPGDYSIPFSFQLPAGLPSTIFYKNRHKEAKPKAQVKYTIKAKI